MKREAADFISDLLREGSGNPYIVRPEGFEPPISAFGGPRVIQLRYGRVGGPELLRLLGRSRSSARQVLEEIELVFDQAPIELAHAIRVSEEIGSRVRQIIAGRVGNVVRDLDLFHLATVDRMWTEIAGYR